MKVVFRKEALDDLAGALSYIAGRNPAAAATVAARIERSLAIIGEFPRAG